MGGRRYAGREDRDLDEDRINLKKVFAVLIVLIIIIAIIVFVIYSMTHKKDEIKEDEVTSSEPVEENKIPKTYEGYDVLGQIVIDKINLTQYILDSTENDAMDKAPVKLYGDEINKEGNFCIAGHNYDEIFANLTELDIGDEFYIEDVQGNTVNYKITQVLEVEPTDLTALMPVTDKIEVTLITCEKEATERLVIKAEKV